MNKNNRFENLMIGISSFIEKRLAPPLVRLGNQRHMAAIRAALIRTIPFIIIGSIPLIFTNLPIKALSDFMAPYANQLNILYTMTMGFTTLVLIFSLGVEMAKMYEELDPVTVAIVSTISYLITVSPVDLSAGTLPIEGLSAKGMFAAFIVSIIVTECMYFLLKYKLTIRMPKSVPSNIAKSFEALIPMFIIIVFFWFIRIVVGFNLYDLINKLITPLISLTDTWYAAIITVLLLQALWFVGIHGGSFTIWGPLYPFLLANIAANATAAAAGEAIPHILTEPFFYTYTMIGGVGHTLPLILIWWNSKSRTLRDVARISFIPGIFCINEPVTFGVPIVLNPILLIPFVFLTSLLGTIYGYVITALGWVSPAIVQIPWTTPPLIQPYLSTGGDWRAVIAQIILFISMYFMWYPFAKLWEKKMIEEESETENNDGADA